MWLLSEAGINFLTFEFLPKYYGKYSELNFVGVQIVGCNEEKMDFWHMDNKREKMVL